MNRSRYRVALIALALVVLPLLAFAAPGATTAPRPTPRPGAPRPAATAPAGGMMRLPMKAPVMADTVLAKVYGARDVTWSALIKGCRKLGVDPNSLTPLERRQVLDVLIDQAILATRAQRDPRSWTARDSAEYAALRDKLLLNTALNEALFEVASGYMDRGDTVPDMRALGIMARDSAMARMHPKYDDWSLRHMAAAFAALPKQSPDMNAMQKIEAMGKLPEMAPADTGRVLLMCDADTLTVGDVLREYARLNPMYRPRIEDEGGVVDLVGNVVFNAQLRAHAEARGYDRMKMNAGQLTEKAEFLDVQRFVTKNVYAKIAMDTVTLRKHYDKHPTWFRSKATTDIVRMTFETQAEAAKWADQLQDATHAESLATKSARAGVPYATTLYEEADSALFKRVRKGGVGAVLGPDSTAQGWRVMRIMKLTLDHRLTFEEGYDQVKQDWYEREGERIMRNVLDEMRKHTIIFVNEKSPYLAVKPRGTR